MIPQTGPKRKRLASERENGSGHPHGMQKQVPKHSVAASKDMSLEGIQCFICTVFLGLP